MSSLVGNYGLSGISYYNQSAVEEYTTTKSISRQQASPAIHQKNGQVLTTLKMDVNQDAREMDMIRPAIWHTYTPSESNRCREELHQKIENFTEKKRSEGSDDIQLSDTHKFSKLINSEIEYATEFWLASKVLISEAG